MIVVKGGGQVAGDELRLEDSIRDRKALESAIDWSEKMDGQGVRTFVSGRNLGGVLRGRAEFTQPSVN